MSETWLRSGDSAKIAEFRNLGYNIHSSPRAGRGGRVAIIFKDSLEVKRNNVKRYKTFEVIEGTYRANGDMLRFCYIYIFPRLSSLKS